MEQWIAAWGLYAVALGAMTEGDATMILAGMAAHRHLMPFAAVFAIGWVGASISDLFLFSLGRMHSDRIQRTALYRKAGPWLDRLATRFGPWQILTARFLYGSRTPTMIFWGLRGLSFARFVPLAVGGAAVWAIAAAGLGWAISGSAALVIGRLHRVEEWALFAVVMAIIATIAVRAFRRRERGGGGPAE